jgi:hypothetical protein
MSWIVGVFLLAWSTPTYAIIERILIPELECGDKTFVDVSVRIDRSRVSITRGEVCARLLMKAELPRSRFLVDSKLPAKFKNLAKRADDFFDIVIFKPKVLNRKRFSFTGEIFQEITTNLSSRRALNLEIGNNLPKNYLAAYRAGTAFINQNTLEDSTCSLINSLVHEYMHHYGYGHGDNSSEGKEGSVPYYFGSRAEELCEAKVI